MYNKIIFLDIDDVLNNSDSGYGGWSAINKGFLDITKKDILFDEKAVDRLKIILKETKAKIIICSTWRILMDIQKLRYIFNMYGFKPNIVIGDTPVNMRGLTDSGFRGTEVREWLENNPTREYIIIDDSNDYYEYQKEKQVQTEVNIGLLDKHVEEAIKLFEEEDDEV